MRSLFLYVLIGSWYGILYRALNFIGRCRAKHRAKLVGMGYVENDTSQRLRAERRSRITGMVYVGVSGTWFLFGPKLLFGGSDGLELIAVLIGSVFPAWAFSLIFAFFEESSSSVGLLYKAMRDGQFHKKGQPIVAKGEMGSSALIVPPTIPGLMANPMSAFARAYQVSDDKVAA